MARSDHALHLCIGAARSGTTWLFNNLAGRDDLFVPPVKEVRFWHGRRSPAEAAATARAAERKAVTPEAREWLARWQDVSDVSADQYRTLMMRPDRPSIDISPIYSIMPTAAVEAVARALPASSRIIYLVRDPLDRLLSQLRLHLYMQGGFRGPVADGTIRRLVTSERMRARSDFQAVADRWTPFFGDRFRVFDHRDLERDAPAFLTALCRFLELDAGDPARLAQASRYFGTDLSPDRVSYAPPFSAVQRAMVAQSLKPVVDRGYAIVPAAVAAAWQAKVADAAEAATPPDSEEPDDPFNRLLRLTESLGEDEEFGEWQRRQGYQPISLFRWARMPPSMLARFLRQKPVSRLFRRQDLVRLDDQWVLDRQTGLQRTSELPQLAGRADIGTSTDPDLLRAFDREREEVLGLRDRFFHQARRCPALYVVKDTHGAADQADAVLDALRALNPAHALLWVRSGADPDVKEVRPGLLAAQLPAFASDQPDNGTDPDGWRRLLHACLLHGAVGTVLRRALF